METIEELRARMKTQAPAGPVCDPCQERRGKLLANGLVETVNEYGYTEYRRLGVDGRLGAVSD